MRRYSDIETKCLFTYLHDEDAVVDVLEKILREFYNFILKFDLRSRGSR